MPEPHKNETLLNTCQNCGHKNRPGVYLCANCGAMLLQGYTPETKKLANEDKQRIDTQEPPMEAATDVSKRTLVFSPEATISIKLKEVPDPLVYTIDDELLIGRYDKNSGLSPGIDMHRFAGYLLGVSRQHAKLYRVGDRLLLEDLGSSNGTHLNGKQLESHERRVVPDNSVIRLGDLHFTLTFR